MTKTNHPKKIILLSTLAGALALGGTALAQPGPGGPGCDGSGPCMDGGGPGRGGRGMGRGHKMGGGGPAMKLLKAMQRLDLTVEQEVQLVRLQRELRKENKDLRFAMRADRKAAFTELKKANPNADLFHQMIDRHSKARTAQMHKAIDKALAFHRTLTPEQKAQLSENMARFEQRMNKRMNRRGQRNR